MIQSHNVYPTHVFHVNEYRCNTCKYKCIIHLFYTCNTTHKTQLVIYYTVAFLATVCNEPTTLCLQGGYANHLTKSLDR